MEENKEIITEEAPENGRKTCFFARFRAFCSRADSFIYSHIWFVLALCFALMLLVTAVKFRIYPETAFKDACFIVNRALSGEVGDLDRSYTLIVRIFGALFSWTGVTGLEQWGWILLVPGAAMALYLIYRARPQSLGTLFIACGFSVLLPFYVFSVGKDFLQFTAFFVIAVLLLSFGKEWQKAVAAIILLIPVTLMFRSYYVLMIGFVIAFYIFALVYRRMLTVKSRAVCLMGTALLVVGVLYVIRFGFPEQAADLFTIRSVVNASYGRTSLSDKVILDLLPLERSVPGFLGNYLLAGIRMSLPVELMGDIGDVPFTVFQLVVTTLFIIELVRSRRVQARTAIYSVALAFFFMSFVFEPDFASWFRHEAAAFPVLWLAIGSDKKTMRGVNVEGQSNGV